MIAALLQHALISALVSIKTFQSLVTPYKMSTSHDSTMSKIFNNRNTKDYTDDFHYHMCTNKSGGQTSKLALLCGYIVIIIDYVRRILFCLLYSLQYCNIYIYILHTICS